MSTSSCPDDTESGGSFSDNNNGYDRVEYKYNRQGQRIEVKDQNATVHNYTFDKLGRMTVDTATTLGGGVVGTVRRIERSYEIRGLTELVTSYDATTGGDEVNQVKLEYNDFGQLTKDSQDHDDVVDGSTPNVQYDYADGTNDHVRLQKITYPNGRLLHYGYDSGDAEINRVSYLADDNGSGSPGVYLAQYHYLGIGRAIKVEYNDADGTGETYSPTHAFDLAFGTNEAYDGLTRFDEIRRIRWTTPQASPNHIVAWFGYEYDYAGNRTVREDFKATGINQYLDEKYTYDGVHRLETFERGNLVSGSFTTKNYIQDWLLDPTGNWREFRDDTNGDETPELDQDRLHNKANEIDTDDVHGNGPGASITATTGTNWGDPLYDAVGNATLLPKPADPANSFTFEYDAWNRLVVVKTNGVFLHAAYFYDGLNRRTTKYHSGGLTDHYYYSNRWQLLEQQDYQGATENQYVWGLRYVDDLVLRDYDFDNNPATGDLGIEDSGLERRRFAMQDAQFNLVAGVSTAGVVQERFTYTPYGVPEFRNQYFAASTNTQDWQTLYAGYQYDPETGLYNVRNRYYHAQLGRFVNRDPIGYDGGLNLYEYVYGNPATDLDPSGLGGHGYRWVEDFWFWLRYKDDFESDESRYERQQRLKTEALNKISSGTFEGGRDGTDAHQAATGDMSQDIGTIKVLYKVAGAYYVIVPGLAQPQMVFRLPGGALPSTSSSSVAAFESASKYGIRPWNDLKKLTEGTGLRAHHLIEQRFAATLGVNPRTMQSIALTPAEHQVFTNAWRQAIPYGQGTANATVQQIQNVARQVYQDFPDILKALGLCQ